MTKDFKDQTGNTIQLEYPPLRIISLVPSQTELLFDLGLKDEIVGITDYCIYPSEQCRQKTKVGGPKSINFQSIELLEPDLILANKEENDREQITKLREKFAVWVSHIVTLEDALAMIKGVGRLVNRQKKARNIISKITPAIDSFSFLGIRVAYFIWKNPYMVAGSGTFIDEMLKKCGLVNVFDSLDRYPEVTENQIKHSAPEAILLSSEPFTFTADHVSEFQDLFHAKETLLVDGEIFSWYGSRLQYAPDYFKSLRQKLEKLST